MFEKLSRMIGVKPFLNKDITQCDPMKPAPPVIKTFFIYLYLQNSAYISNFYICTFKYQSLKLNRMDTLYF